MEDQVTSEEYEEKAVEALKSGNTIVASVLSQLALVAVVREAALVLLSIDDEDDDDDEGHDDE